MRKYMMRKKYKSKKTSLLPISSSIGLIFFILMIFSFNKFLHTINISAKSSAHTLTVTPTIIPGFVPNPLDMQVYVSAKVVGIGKGGNRNPKHFTRYVTVSIYNMKNELTNEGNGYITYDRENLFHGIIHLGPVGNDIYYIKILSPRMLRAIVVPAFRALDDKNLNILPQVKLIQGDINEDNIIDITDYNLSLSCFQDKKCEDKNLIDFNDDGLTDIIDYNILLQDYWELEGD